MDIATLARTRRTAKAFDPTRKLPAPLVEQLLVLLRFSPSSVNSQPWHFIVVGTEAGKARIARAAQGAYAYNAPKIQAASHVLVFCVRTGLDEAQLEAILAQEEQDGRYPAPEDKVQQRQTRLAYLNLHRTERQDLRAWMEKQVYLALGTLLFAAAAADIDACPMEGYDPRILDEELGLPARGLASVALVALGYRGAGDWNARLPKSRLPRDAVLTII